MNTADSFSFWFIVLIVHCMVHNNIVNCTECDELLKEDLLLPDDVHLKDEDYEIVQFWHTGFNSGDDNIKQLRFKRSGKDVQFTMKETSIIREKTPVWLAYNDWNITKADENIISDAVKFYEHPELIATFASAFDEYNHRYFLGSISQQAVVPLSNRTIRSLMTEKPHLFEDNPEPGSVDETGEFTVTNYHVIYKSKLPESGSIVLPPMGHPEMFTKSRSNQLPQKRLRRAVPDVIYPEILAILDYKQKYTTIYEHRFLNLLTYTISFWNSVNHRYEALKNPQIRLRLTGIVVLMNRDEITAIRDATVSNMLNANQAMRQLSSWVVERIDYDSDIIMTHTNTGLCSETIGAARCIGGGTLGMAIHHPLCRYTGWNLMTGIFYDNMKHSGEASAAHEVGHIFGAEHDESTSPYDCTDTKGYIMSWDARYKDRNFEWSRCSKEDISAYLEKASRTCLYNAEPAGKDQGELVQKELLPGENITPDYQCMMKGYTHACEATDICTNLSCKWWLCSNAGPALEGTPCPGGHCHNRKCVANNNE